MPENRIIFWKYDIFPFMLWGELRSFTKSGFTVKGYSGSFMRKSAITVLRSNEAQHFIESLTRIKADRQAILEYLEVNRRLIEDSMPKRLHVRTLLRELDACEHPELKRDKAGRILCVCGKPLESSKHIQYGPDVDNPLKHVFDPATLDAAKPSSTKATVGRPRGKERKR